MKTAPPTAAPKITFAGRCCGEASAAIQVPMAGAAASPAAAAEALKTTQERTSLWLAAELELLQRLLYKIHAQHRKAHFFVKSRGVLAAAARLLRLLLLSCSVSDSQQQQQLIKQTRPLLTHEQPYLLPEQQLEFHQAEASTGLAFPRQQHALGLWGTLKQLLAAAFDIQQSVQHAAAAASQLLHLGYHVGVVLPLLAVYGRLAALGLSLSVAIEQQLQQQAEQLQSANDAAAVDVLLHWSESCRSACDGRGVSATRPLPAAAAAFAAARGGGLLVRNASIICLSETSAAAGAALASGSSGSSSLPRQFVAYAVSATPRLLARSITEEAVAREWAAAARGDDRSEGALETAASGETLETAEEGWLCVGRGLCGQQLFTQGAEEEGDEEEGEEEEPSGDFFGSGWEGVALLPPGSRGSTS
ncbi:uncharacterized protein LOC34618444 [Cyclospora cayetanensis]|uniref:Uncharacterized protein LOC34618444 n=1 Tax=Cyclospora cayetanensis TaxID=88456 RepID=A0A6P6RQM7_9EIME|nr:uncharacterized protein LOC34618444 [Cyclospora cayetanensis]